MARRTARRGANSGREFWGCGRFAIDGCSGKIDIGLITPQAEAHSTFDPAIDLYGDDVSAAGGSARAEFERQQNEHDDRTRPHRPWLLAGCATGAVPGVAAFLTQAAMLGAMAFLAVVVVGTAVELLPASARNWATGADGESLTALALEELRIEGFVILHDRLIPGSTANIDHIVIGPPGVAVVETKSYSGRLWVRGNDVYVDGYCRTWKTVGETKREAAAVTVALAGELGRLSLSVRPILCVHRADLPFFGASPQGVTIVDGWGLAKILRAARPVLAPEDVRALARIANDRLRPTAAQMPSDDRPVAQPWQVPEPVGDERYVPPARRDQLRIAREARATATDQRVYWTNRGLIEGKAPPTIRPG
jgi:hypothetical protein